MEEIKFDIIEYMGKLDDAIYTLLSLNYDEEFYEGIFFYKDKFVVLTVQQELEEVLGSEIEDWDGYNNLMLQIIDKLPSYDELLKTVGEFDSNTYEIIYPNK